MSNRIFIDSNVWIYIFLNDSQTKSNVAKNYIDKNYLTNTLVISYQVINEVTNVLKRKGFQEIKLREIISILSTVCIVQNYTKELAILASDIRENHSFSFWDSHILASAIFSNCNILASEDMQDNRAIKNVTIKNIF